MLRTRLLLGLLPLLVLVLGMGVYAMRTTRSLAESSQRQLVVQYSDLQSIERMRAAARAMAGSIESAASRPLAARRNFEEQQARVKRELLEQSGRAAGTARQTLVRDADEAFQHFSALSRILVDAGGTGSLPDLEAEESALYGLLHRIDALEQEGYAHARDMAAKAGALAARSSRVLAGVVASVFALSVFLAWRMAAAILRPVRALTAAVEAAGEGHPGVRVPESSADELGRLARSFNTMADKLRAYREATAARVLRVQRTMEATLASTPDPLFVVARDGAQEVRNPAADALARLAEFSKGLPDPIAGPLARVLESGEHYIPADYSRLLTIRVDGEERHYLPRILAIGDALTEFAGAAVILQDVTKFRLLDTAKTNLVGTVSHELKTPLTSLRMAVYLLIEESLGPLTPAQRDMLESARDDANRLLGILDSLLDLARLEAGASSLERRQIPVADILEDIAAEARPVLAAAGQELGVSMEKGLGSVDVDPVRIRHVFMNLLSNASKYSPPGSPIGLRADCAPAGYVRFAVRDRGIGIPAEALPHLFDRFYRVPGVSKPGAGIGLAIAREIVVAHGGSIACASEPGRGSEFHFLLPQANFSEGGGRSGLEADLGDADHSPVAAVKE